MASWPRKKTCQKLNATASNMLVEAAQKTVAFLKGAFGFRGLATAGV